VNLVAGSVEKARIDEHHAFLDRADALGEIHGGAPFLIHDPDLERVSRQAEQVFHRAE
jgi:hypothetical protein